MYTNSSEYAIDGAEQKVALQKRRNTKTIYTI